MISNQFQNNEKNLSLLISSCDSYSDLWNPCLKMFDKFWRDCPYKKYLLCETKNIKTNNELKNFNINIINVASSYWSERLLIALDKIDTEYVLLYLDDFFLKRKVSTIQINKLFDIVKKNEINMLRLIPRPGPKNLYNENKDTIGILQPDDRFYVSTQASIWKKEILKSLLVKEESIWEFEEKGSIRAKNTKSFYSVYKSVIPYIHHDIERAKWFPWSYFLYKKYLLENKREILGPFFIIKFFFMKLFLPILRLFRIIK